MKKENENEGVSAETAAALSATNPQPKTASGFSAAIADAPAHRPPFLSDAKLTEIEAHNRIAYRINTGSDLRAMDHGGGVYWGLTCCRDLYEIRLQEIIRTVDEVHTMLENAAANYADGTTKGPGEADKLGRLAHMAATKLARIINE